MNELGQIFNYCDRYAQRVYVADAPAGTNYLTADAVPDGEIWVVNNIAAMDATSATTRISLDVYDGSIWINLDGKLSPAALEFVTWRGWLVLKAKDKVRATFVGVTAGDKLYFDVRGFKMRIV